MNRKILAVRGAVSVRADDEKSMAEAVETLIDALEESNDFKISDVISLQFTQTVDLQSGNAATLLRRVRSRYNDVPLFCAQEPICRNSLPKIIRVLVTWHGKGGTRPVYLGEARNLRLDLGT